MKPIATSNDQWTEVLECQREIDNLIATIAEQLDASPIVTDALMACGLEPTSRAFWLAADSAVNVLLAHDIGQTVGEGESPEAADETKAPAA